MPINKQSDKKIVKQLQLDLQLLGFNVGKSGADGWYGNNTQGAAYDFAEDHSLSMDFENGINDEVVKAITEAANKKRNPEITLPPKFLDLTNVAFPGPRRGKRDWKNINSLIIHQTGCKMPANNPKRWSNHITKNKEGVLVNSSLKAQVGITTVGEIYLIHPLNELVWHGNGLSTWGPGLEISGCFNGIENDPKTYPGPKGQIPSKLTPEQLESIKNFIIYFKKVLQSHGSDLKYVLPHSASSATRKPDPGQEIYREVCLWAEKELGVNLGGPDFKIGSGYKTPVEWNPAYTGNKY